MRRILDERIFSLGSVNYNQLGYIYLEAKDKLLGIWTSVGTEFFKQPKLEHVLLKGVGNPKGCSDVLRLLFQAFCLCHTNILRLIDIERLN